MPRKQRAGIAQLVEHNLAKVGVASSNLVSRSKNIKKPRLVLLLLRLFSLGSLEDTPGWVAEWLCSGLQLRVRRFDSDPRLQFISVLLQQVK